jgi:hypothetical protein
MDLITGKPITVTDAGSQISFIAATSRIATTQNDFLTKGFRPGMVVQVASSSLNDGYYPITFVASDGSYMTTSGTIVDEAASAATPTISVPNGVNWATMFKYGIFVIYSSPIGDDADAAEGGTKLAELTESAGAFTPGTSTNGLEVEFSADGVFTIKSGQAWRDDTPVAAGTAYYGILYDNAYLQGDDSINKYSPRIMGTVGVSGSGRDFIISSTGITTTIPVTCTQFQGTQASQACS